MTKYLLLLALVACGPGGGGEGPNAGAPADADACPAPFTFYFHREGGAYARGGTDNPITDVSTVLPQNEELAPWAGDADGWAQILACARAGVAPFDIEISEVEPTGGAYSEIVFTDTAVFPPEYTGMSPSSCGQREPHLSFVFGSAFDNDPTLACSIVMFQIGTVTALDASLDPCDYMSLFGGCPTTPAYQDADTECGIGTAAPCRCGGQATENTYQTMLSAYGPACLQ